MIRTFFKTLRVLLGPVMLAWERISRPAGVVRTATAQNDVDQQCRSLALYQFKTCPFCMKVRKEMHRLSLKIEKRDAQHQLADREALIQGGGSAKVPCLKITHPDGKVQWMYESSAILAYLKSRFEPVAA
jgi:glutaredoxin